jgi:hypothetical protein
MLAELSGLAETFTSKLGVDVTLASVDIAPVIKTTTFAVADIEALVATLAEGCCTLIADPEIVALVLILAPNPTV